MLNIIWLTLIVTSVIIGAINGRLTQVANAVTSSAELAFTVALSLTGILAFWLGLMKIAEESGLVQILSRLIRPVMVKLFPDVPANHPAMGAMVLNISSNMLGLANAATPFGLRAMEELEKLNKLPGTATNAMCTFLALNTAGLQLIPTTAIALLAAAGAKTPTDIIITSLIATICGTTAAIITVKSLEKLNYFAVIPTKQAQTHDTLSP